MPEFGKFEKKKLTPEKRNEDIFEEYQKFVIEKLRENPIELLPEFSSITVEELKEKFPNKKIVACDFYVKEVESGKKDVGGYVFENIINIDHHAPTEEMARRISSTNLAIEWVKKYGGVPKDWVVAINHTDCDSVLSSAILRQILPPEEKFAKAAISADHTGEENEITDLLMALEKERNFEYSLTNLKLLLDGKNLDEKTKKLLEKRFKERKKAKELVESGAFKQIENIYYVKVDERIDAAFFPALLPEAVAIMIAIPMKGSDKMEVKIRLGLKAPPGLMLNKLALPDFGGRWNAGSTKRHGGTSIPVEKYAQILNEKIKKELMKKQLEEMKRI